MRVRKLISITLAVFCFGLTLALTSCSFFSSDEGSSQGGADTLAQADQNVQAAQNQLTQRQKVAKDLRETANKAKLEADTLEQRAKKNHIDTTDPNSQTYQARKAQTDAETAADEADTAVTVAAEAVRTAQARVETVRTGTQARSISTAQPADSNERNKFGSDVPWLPLALAAFAGLILCILFFLTWNRISGLQANIEKNFQDLTRKGDERHQGLNSSMSGLKDITTRIGALEKEIRLLRQIAENEQDERFIAARKSGTQTQARTGLPEYEIPVQLVEEDVAQFPASASSLLTRLGAQSTILKSDPLKGMLVQDPDGRGQLVLMGNQGIANGQFYIVPRITRFQTKEDFYNHYEQFYDCQRPAAGEVWLHEPAIVEKVDGGWRLQNKGLIEIR